MSAIFSSVLDAIHDRLSFSQSVSPHFIEENGIGRHGISGMIVGMVLGTF